MGANGDVFVVLDAEVPVAIYASRGVAERDADALRREATRVRGFPSAADEIEVRGYPVHVAPRLEAVPTEGASTSPGSHPGPPVPGLSTGRHLTVVPPPSEKPW